MTTLPFYSGAAAIPVPSIYLIFSRFYYIVCSSPKLTALCTSHTSHINMDINI